MSNIIKTTQGEVFFKLKEEFENKDKASKGEEPIDSVVVLGDIKIENIKYKLKEVLKDGNS
mgnify:FL=1